MLHLLPHHRIHIPNGLAMFAALLLLLSSVAGFGTSQEMQSSGHEIAPLAQVESNQGHSIHDATGPKRRALNLSLLLFRR